MCFRWTGSLTALIYPMRISEAYGADLNGAAIGPRRGQGGQHHNPHGRELSDETQAGSDRWSLLPHGI